MDQQLNEIAGRFCAFVRRQTQIEMTRNDEWENEILTIILTPRDFTYTHTLGYCLTLELEVKGQILNYTIVVEGVKLENSLKEFVTWLDEKQQQLLSGVEVCGKK